MEIQFVQRWRERRGTYRPAGEPARARDFEIEPIGFKEARDFVRAHHYSAEYAADRRRWGMRDKLGRLVGVAVFGNSQIKEAVTNYFPGGETDSIEFLRLVMLDWVPANAESILTGYCIRRLRAEGFVGLLSMADPEERTDAGGNRVFCGHLGTIYQATGATFAGRATPRSLYLLPDGTVFGGRAVSKIQSGKRGWEYASRKLERWGATAAPADRAGRREWLAYWLDPARGVVRRKRHRGNLRYLWALDPKAAPEMTENVLRRMGRRSLPGYPKFLGDPQMGFSFAP